MQAVPDNDVLVGIPVTPAAADLLRDEARARAVGRLVSDLLQPSSADRDPLAALIAELKAEVQAAGGTDADIDAELAAYNAERRL